MKCKTCSWDTEEALMAYGEGSRHGWSPSFGDCIFCFCYAAFGGILEPWGGPAERALQIYEITPAGVRSRPSPEMQAALDKWYGCDEIPF